MKECIAMDKNLAITFTPFADSNTKMSDILSRLTGSFGWISEVRKRRKSL